MKIRNRIFQITVLLLLITTMSQAQFKNLGVGIAYGTQIKKPGVLINGQYYFSDKFALAPSFIYYLPYSDKSSNTVFGFTSSIEAKSTVWELNADANYYFLDQGVKLYGIGGLNVTGVKSKITTSVTGLPTTETSANSTNVGVNLGIGADFKAGEKIVPFLNLKYTISNYDQLVIAGGIRFLLK